MKIYDTALRQQVVLKLPELAGLADATAQHSPAHGLLTNHTNRPVISIYTCGVTPYDAAHLGHIFTFQTYDLLQRRLEDLGYAVRLVRNITDVDDPIFKRAKELGIPYQELADQETERLQTVMRQLHMRPAAAEPKASDYIQDMADAVRQLLDSGHAYSLDNSDGSSDIYFDISTSPGFAEETHLPYKLQLAFMADRGGDPGRSGKRQPLDFLLWHGVSDPEDSAAWDTGIGRGRPGWHIECSVMSAATLGTPFAIHGGGMDLIFPHHACEIAQTKALTNGELSKHWLHVAPLSFAGEKMSKSLGNLVFAHDLLKVHKPNVVRLALMHYRHRVGGEWQSQALEKAASLDARLQQCMSAARQPELRPYLDNIRAALDDDLNTPKVIRILQQLAEAPPKIAANTQKTEQDSITFLLGLQYS